MPASRKNFPSCYSSRLLTVQLTYSFYDDATYPSVKDAPFSADRKPKTFISGNDDFMSTRIVEPTQGHKRLGIEQILRAHPFESLNPPASRTRCARGFRRCEG